MAKKEIEIRSISLLPTDVANLNLTLTDHDSANRNLTVGCAALSVKLTFSTSICIVFTIFTIPSLKAEVIVHTNLHQPNRFAPLHSQG